MKKRILIALVVVLALAATASLVWAGGGPNGTLLTWPGDYAWYLRTGSGIVHQWRPNPPVLHVVLKPLGRFPDAQQEGCETDEGTLRVQGVFVPATHSWDDPSLAFTIYDQTETYFFCGYEWQWPE